MFSSELLSQLVNLYVKFSNVSCVSINEVPQQLNDYLVNNDITFRLNGELCVKSIIRFALELIKLGLDPELVSKPLSWRDFEGLVSEYLSLNDYYVIKNLRFSRKRYEVDVLGVDQVSGIGIVIDCKHWSPGYGKKGRLVRIASEHRSKVEEFSKDCLQVISKYSMLRKVKIFVSVILTLTDVVRGYVGGSFIVPILRFNDFITNLRYYIDAFDSGVVVNNCYGRN
ncbi:MAG: hypothetical protein QXO98_00515 [Sulfolobales archaeon]